MIRADNEIAPEMTAGKSELRRECREAVRGLTPAYKAAASASIADRLVNDPAFTAAETVFVYLSTPNEPDTAAIIDRALAMGKTVCVPRTYEPPRMEAVRFTSRAELVPGRFGILEPPASAPVIPAESIDLAVVPCVCVSADGRRLGHGGGYYDVFLGAHPRIASVCLCFGALVREDVPIGPTDVCIDRVIRETAEIHL